MDWLPILACNVLFHNNLYNKLHHFTPVQQFISITLPFLFLKLFLLILISHQSKSPQQSKMSSSSHKTTVSSSLQNQTKFSVLSQTSFHTKTTLFVLCSQVRTMNSSLESDFELPCLYFTTWIFAAFSHGCHCFLVLYIFFDVLQPIKSPFKSLFILKYFRVFL